MTKINTFHLVISDSQCSVIEPSGDIHAIPVGSTTLSNRFFNHGTSDMALEYAIAYVEDAVMPLDKLMSSPRDLLETTFSTIKDPSYTWLKPGEITNLDKFESRFNRALKNIHSKMEIANLLIIRELANHLRFKKIAFKQSKLI